MQEEPGIFEVDEPPVLHLLWHQACPQPIEFLDRVIPLEGDPLVLGRHWLSLPVASSRDPHLAGFSPSGHFAGWGVRKGLGAGVARRGTAVTPVGGVGVGVGAGEIPVMTRPSRLPSVSVNQMLASGPTVIHSGSVEGLGTAGSGPSAPLVVMRPMRFK